MKNPLQNLHLKWIAVRTGLEPATPCVTGTYSNQLNYHTILFKYGPSDDPLSLSGLQRYAHFFNLQIFFEIKYGAEFIGGTSRSILTILVVLHEFKHIRNGHKQSKHCNNRCGKYGVQVRHSTCRGRAEYNVGL